jgi:hypothetical protein
LRGRRALRCLGGRLAQERRQRRQRRSARKGPAASCARPPARVGCVSERLFSAIEPQTTANGTLKAIVRVASAMLIISWRSLGSGVASTRNSARLSPTCASKGEEWARDGTTDRPGAHCGRVRSRHASAAALQR